MKYFERIVQNKIDLLWDAKPGIVLTGMRRVGKTTLMKYYFDKIESENKILLDLEDALTRKIFQEENYENVVLALEQRGINFDEKVYLFIDEIQFVQNIPSVLKYIYDKYDIKFFVTGSSSFYIKNHFSQSMSGRKFIIELHTLTFSEYLTAKEINKKDYDSFAESANNKIESSVELYNDLYEEYIKYGGFPEVVLSDNVVHKKELLKDIMNSYFKIDVASLADFSDIAVLRDLLTLLTQRIGSKINITNLANVLNIKRDKVYEYLEFLQSTFVIKTISQKSSVDNKVSSDNKLYFTDIGLAGLLADIGRGAMFENGAYMNLAYYNDITYFQTGSGHEIDFVINNKIGLEVKMSTTLVDIANTKKRANSAALDEYYVLTGNFSVNPNVIMVWDIPSTPKNHS